jgi:hypothetical protein
MEAGIVLLNPGSALAVGRDTWLPGVGYDVSLLRHDQALADLFRATSHQHLEIAVNNMGRLTANENLRSYNHGYTSAVLGKPFEHYEPNSPRRGIGRMLKNLVSA